MKNGSKINQNSIKNGPYIVQKSTKIEAWKAPGQVWRRLGASWAIQSVFGASWNVLRASWRPLGRASAEKVCQHGSNLAFKTEVKSIKNRSENWSIFKCLLESNFGRILVDFGCQYEAKLNPKWDQTSVLTSEGDFQKTTCSFRKTTFFRSNRSKLGAKIK